MMEMVRCQYVSFERLDVKYTHRACFRNRCVLAIKLRLMDTTKTNSITTLELQDRFQYILVVRYLKVPPFAFVLLFPHFAAPTFRHLAIAPLAYADGKTLYLRLTF